MRAVIISQAGGPDVLELAEVARPEPGARQIRVRVLASGVNRADVLQRRGHYPGPAGAPATIPGLEYAGVVDRIGSDVRQRQVGDRVMGLVGGGAYAEFVVVNEQEAIGVPASLSLEAAAALPEAFLTAYDALHTRAAVKSGEHVLVHALASGVGTAAAQLAHAFGCTVHGTSRTAWKLERAAELGVDFVTDVSSGDFVGELMTRSQGHGADVILDLVGGDYLGRNLEVLAQLGRIVVIGLVGGRTAELDMGVLLRKRATIVGTVMRSRGLNEKIEIARAFTRDVLPLLESGQIRPVVDRIIGIEDVAHAHRVMEANENFGKLVLSWEA